jgi:hypothetical protein
MENDCTTDREEILSQCEDRWRGAETLDSPDKLLASTSDRLGPEVMIILTGDKMAKLVVL